MGGNGSNGVSREDFTERLFQSGIKEDEPKEKAYQGHEKRDLSSRVVFTEREKAFISAINARVNRRDQCVIDQKHHEHANHPFEAAEELGRGNVAEGINIARDSARQVYSQTKLAGFVVKGVLISVAVAFVSGVCGLIYIGIQQKLKGM